jgi:hypothetical protein
VTALALRGSFGSGVRAIAAIVRSPGAAPIVVEDAVVLGRLTAQIVRTALRATPAGDSSKPTHRCRTFGANRVDCEMSVGDGCFEMRSVTRRREGMLVAHPYSCAGERNPFRPHPNPFDHVAYPLLLLEHTTPLPPISLT